MSAEWVNAIATTVGVIVAIGGVSMAYFQLKNLRKDLKMSSLMAVLEIESEMNKRKEKLDEVNFNIRKLENEGKLTEKLAEILEDENNCALENYLNSIDRLAYCILKGYLSDRDWKTEYRDLIFKTLRDNENKFGTGTFYNNTVKLYENWKSV